jgi:hypothetical protein
MIRRNVLDRSPTSAHFMGIYNRAFTLSAEGHNNKSSIQTAINEHTRSPNMVKGAGTKASRAVSTE